MSIDEIVKETAKKQKGKMIIFISSKGGVGKTVVSVNTAVALANKGFSTCILDGNFQFGDVNMALDIRPTFTISNIIEEFETLENIKIAYYLDKHNSGVSVLAAPIKPEDGDLITNSAIKSICKKILEEYDFLIVDLPSGLCENNLTFMEMAYEIFIVTDKNFAALKNTKVILRIMNMLNMNEKLKVVINRSNTQSIIKAGDIRHMLKVKEVFFICNDSKIVLKSLDAGVPFVKSNPKERISKDIIALASDIYNKVKPDSGGAWSPFES